jgi:hypothetical protein
VERSREASAASDLDLVLVERLSYPAYQVLVRHVSCLEDGVRYCLRPGPSVAVDHHIVHAKYRSAAVFLIVDPSLDAGQRRHHHARRDARQQVSRDFGLQQLEDLACHALCSLEQHVTREPVAHHNVHGAVEDVISLHVAHKVEIELAKRFIGLLHHLRSLGVLASVAEKGYPRILDASTQPDIDVAHDRELHEVRWIYGRVRPNVEDEHSRLLTSGYEASKRWTVYAGERAPNPVGDRHDRGAIPG